MRRELERNDAEVAPLEWWRRDVRIKLLRSAVLATESLTWSQDLLDLLLDELYVEDDLEALLGSGARGLRKRQYPQAIAVALLLRHSWCPDDLAYILNRLGVSLPKRSRTLHHDRLQSPLD